VKTFQKITSQKIRGRITDDGKGRTNSIYSMHTIHMMFNNSGSIIAYMNLKKLEKEKLVDCR
jgi:hypothetical protein